MRHKMKRICNHLFMAAMFGLSLSCLLVSDCSPKVQAQQPDLQYSIRQATAPLVEALEKSVATNRELVRSNNNLARALDKLSSSMRH